jgi:limonene 1,2-monooxygenase
MQLDHQTQGRVIFGVGPGQLPSDAYMLGIEVARQRDMMNEALEVVIPLLEGKVVTRRTDWFDLREARLQLLPFTRPRVEIAVAASISPAGPRAAGRFGISMLSMAASSPDGFSALPQHWGAAEQLAAEHGQSVQRGSWRLVAPMHLAETRERAIADVSHGILDLTRYIERLGGAALPYSGSVDLALEQWTQRGISVFGTALIGTPDDAVAQIERFQKQSGGFGGLLLLAHDCADPERTLNSYRLFARHVMPEVNRTNANRQASLDWCAEHSGEVIGALRGALQKSIREHEEDRARRGQKSGWADRTNLLVGSKD